VVLGEVVGLRVDCGDRDVGLRGLRPLQAGAELPHGVVVGADVVGDYRAGLRESPDDRRNAQREHSAALVVGVYEGEPKVEQCTPCGVLGVSGGEVRGLDPRNRGQVGGQRGQRDRAAAGVVHHVLLDPVVGHLLDELRSGEHLAGGGQGAQRLEGRPV